MLGRRAAVRVTRLDNLIREMAANWEFLKDQGQSAGRHRRAVSICGRLE